jgi:hypothetical protein
MTNSKRHTERITVSGESETKTIVVLHTVSTNGEFGILTVTAVGYEAGTPGAEVLPFRGSYHRYDGTVYVNDPTRSAIGAPSQLLDIRIAADGDDIVLQGEWGTQSGAYEIDFVIDWEVIEG